MTSRSPSSTRLRLEAFEDRLCLSTGVWNGQEWNGPVWNGQSVSFVSIEVMTTPSQSADADQVGSGDLADDADAQESIAMSGYVKVKKLTSGG
jgi:hypothetical protein